MKIALLTELFWPYQLGGGEKQFFELAKYLAKKHEVHVYTVKLPGAPKEEVYKGINIHRVGLLRHPLDRRSLAPLPFYTLALLLTRLPKDVDLIHCNAYLPCIAGFIKARMRKKPVVAVIHDIYRGTWGEALGNKLLGPAGDFIEELVCKLPHDKIVTVSSATKKNLVKTFRLPKGKIEVCGSGIEVEPIDSARGKKVKNRIIYVGRLVPHKHVDELILAVDKLRKDIPEVECKVVGDGILRGRLKGLVEELKLGDKVEFIGGLPSYEGVLSLIKTSEVLVLPSTKEGFGLVVLEAMRCRTVPVVYELQAYRDFSTVSEVVFVRPRDVGALARSIKGLLQNRKKLKRMAESGFKKAGGYTWEKFSERVEKVFKSVRVVS